VRVLVTGGTGFVGSHTVAALAAEGHELRLLVRRPERIAPALHPLGLTDRVDHVVGDVTDADSIRNALAGCDAVVHAAAVFSLDTRAAAETARTNLRGTENVLRTAAEHGCDPIGYVSTTLALLRKNATVTADSPVSAAPGAYTESKSASERVARGLQDDGAPVVCVYPGGVYGPHDPHLSDNMQRLRDVLRGLYPMWPAGGIHAVDVRDVARVSAAVMRPGGGPRRFVVPGSFLDGRTFYRTLRALTGRRLPMLTAPSAALLPLAWLTARAQRFVPFHLPADHEALVANSYATRFDDSATRTLLGIEPRPLEETLSDAVSWLRQAGHITARQAGRLRAA
jgi:nucleoside-diphosphate-sugar epimerase